MSKYRGTIFFAAGAAAALAFGWFAFPRVLYQRAAQPVAFSHKTHTGEKGGMKCGDCHAIRADGRFSGIPGIAKCAECHAGPLGDTPEEKAFISNYITPNREPAWLRYSEQPDNAFFSHAYHVNLAKLACEQCHGNHGQTGALRPYERNRISGYSRDIWGASISRIGAGERPGMKMSDCENCHEQRGVKTGCVDCHK
jgi:hypothetical protein